MIARTVLLALTLSLAACAGRPQPEAQPTTERESLERSARLAFDQGQYPQAATLYAAALEEALAEDRAAAIVDMRFNLALARTYLGDYQAALRQVVQADAERVRRGLGPDPELELLRATIHYRAGDLDQAQPALERLLTDPTLKPAARDRAHFVAGLIAADRADAAALRSHFGSLVPNAAPGAQADRLELQARLAGIDGNTDQALRLLEQAIDMRSLDRDYRGMVRALATAGDIAEQAGKPVLAGNYLLRAGRSAAQRSEPEARRWLQRAHDLGVRSGDRALTLEATAILETLDDR
jgi:tetratricopeptide (TPR) repeat protein